MAKSEMVDVIVSGVPAELKDAVTKEAEAEEMSASEAAVSILATEFGVEFEPRRAQRVVPKPAPNPEILYLTMPRPLRRKIHTRAAAHEVSPSEVMRTVLLRHFALPVTEAA